MSRVYLGETFDIHGGGADLIFPHHENEIAQSQMANHAPFARYWVHNGLINIDHEKMSKSLGNFLTVRDILQSTDAQAIRYFLLATHYRAPMQYTAVALQEAETRVRYVYETLERLRVALTPGPQEGPYRFDGVSSIVARFFAALHANVQNHTYKTESMGKNVFA